MKRFNLQNPLLEFDIYKIKPYLGFDPSEGLFEPIDGSVNLFISLFKFAFNIKLWTIKYKG